MFARTAQVEEQKQGTNFDLNHYFDSPNVILAKPILTL